LLFIIVVSMDKALLVSRVSLTRESLVAAELCPSNGMLPQPTLPSAPLTQLGVLVKMVEADDTEVDAALWDA
jgi:hypothetical protein